MIFNIYYMNKYKIYALVERVTMEIRYVGMTTVYLEERLRKHKLDKIKSYKTNWINKIGSDNIDILLIDDDIQNIEDLKNKEIFYISKYRNMGYRLTNTTNGGDGWTGLTFSEQHRNNISLNHADVSGDKNPMFGKTHSSVSRDKISVKLSGVPRSKEVVENLSAISTGSLNNNSKLKEDDIINIRKYYKIGYKKSELAIMFGVKQPAIHKIVEGITWKHLK